MPVLESMLAGFSFVILSFHSNNGSEYINKTLAQLLNKLFIRFTKTRPRHSNDNGLVETENGQIVRKHPGYGYIPQVCAEAVNRYYCEYLNIYINFHGTCFFLVTFTDYWGKTGGKYPYHWVMIPYKKLRSLPLAESCLHPWVTMDGLDDIARRMSDYEFTERVVRARYNLFQHISTSQVGISVLTELLYLPTPISKSRFRPIFRLEKTIVPCIDTKISIKRKLQD